MKLIKLLPLIVGCFLIYSCSDSGELGPAPEISVEKLSDVGQFTGLKAFKGKVVLIDFWATWCGPCLAAMPKVQALHQELESKGLEVMGVTTEERGIVTRFFQKHQLPYPIYLDGDGTMNKAFHVTAIPTLVVIGRSGNIVFQGFIEDEKLRPAIDKAIAESS